MLGAQGGAGLATRIGGNFIFAPEINVSEQGAKMDFIRSPEYQLVVLNLPLMLQYHAKVGKHGAIYAETGPQPSLLLHGKIIYNDDSKTKITNDYKTFGMQWSAGIGYIRKHVGVNLRVSPGLTDITDNNLTSTRQFTTVLRLIYIF
jgi:hypothetical protein